MDICEISLPDSCSDYTTKADAAPYILTRKCGGFTARFDNPYSDAPEGSDTVSLFERVACICDENGIWQVDLECTPFAMEHIFSAENIASWKRRLQDQEPKQTSTVSVEEDYIEFLRTACCDVETGKPEFSHFEIKYILQVLRQLPVTVLSRWSARAHDKLVLYHYLKDRYACLNQDAENKAILDRLTYLLEIIRRDLQKPNSVSF